MNGGCIHNCTPRMPGAMHVTCIEHLPHLPTRATPCVSNECAVKQAFSYQFIQNSSINYCMLIQTPTLSPYSHLTRLVCCLTFLQHLPPTNLPPLDCDLFGSTGSPLIQAVPHLVRQTTSTDSTCTGDDGSIEVRHLLKEYDKTIASVDQNQLSSKTKKVSSTGKTKFNWGPA